MGINSAAVLRKDEDGKLHIKETADMGGRKGLAIGGVGGAAIGLIAGAGLVVPVAVGALIGGPAAKLRDSGFDDKRLKQVGEGLNPGTSAILAVVEHTWAEEVEKAMQEEGADLLTETLQSDIAAQLEAGHDVAYTALARQGGFMAAREATGADEVEGGMVLVGQNEALGVNYVATPGGFAAYGIEATPEGVTEPAVIAARDPSADSANLEQKA